MSIFIVKGEGEDGNVMAGVWNAIILVIILAGIVYLILELGDSL